MADQPSSAGAGSASRERDTTLAKVARLHDHKGGLSVVWHQKPDAMERAIVAAAWALENECLIEHSWPGGCDGDSYFYVADNWQTADKRLTDDEHYSVHLACSGLVGRGRE